MACWTRFDDIASINNQFKFLDQFESIGAHGTRYMAHGTHHCVNKICAKSTWHSTHNFTSVCFVCMILIDWYVVYGCLCLFSSLHRHSCISFGIRNLYFISFFAWKPMNTLIQTTFWEWICSVSANRENAARVCVFNARLTYPLSGKPFSRYFFLLMFFKLFSWIEFNAQKNFQINGQAVKKNSNCITIKGLKRKS